MVRLLITCPDAAQEAFQRDFWKLRAAEYKPYLLLYEPLQIKQGELSSPLYFDYIAFAQLAAGGEEMPRGLQVGPVWAAAVVRPLPLRSWKRGARTSSEGWCWCLCMCWCAALVPSTFYHCHSQHTPCRCMPRHLAFATLTSPRVSCPGAGVPGEG